jgi:hypothetical protein
VSLGTANSKPTGGMGLGCPGPKPIHEWCRQRLWMDVCLSFLTAKQACVQHIPCGAMMRSSASAEAAGTSERTLEPHGDCSTVSVKWTLRPRAWLSGGVHAQQAQSLGFSVPHTHQKKNNKVRIWGRAHLPPEFVIWAPSECLRQPSSHLGSPPNPHSLVLPCPWHGPPPNTAAK